MPLHSGLPQTLLGGMGIKQNVVKDASPTGRASICFLYPFPIGLEPKSIPSKIESENFHWLNRNEISAAWTADVAKIAQELMAIGTGPLNARDSIDFYLYKHPILIQFPDIVSNIRTSVIVIIDSRNRVGFILLNAIIPETTMDSLICFKHLGHMGGSEKWLLSNKQIDDIIKIEILLPNAREVVRPFLKAVARRCFDTFMSDHMKGDFVTDRPIEQTASIVEFRGSAKDLCGSAEQYLQKHHLALYGLLSGDEGWRFVPTDLARQRLRQTWGSRGFYRVCALGSSVLILNFDGETTHTDSSYRTKQRQLWTHYYGAVPPYFSVDSEIAGLHHGPLVALLECAIIENVCQNEERRCRDLLEEYHEEMKKEHQSEGIKWPPLFEMRTRLTKWLDRICKPKVAEIAVLKQLLFSERQTSQYIRRVEEHLTELNAEIRFVQQQYVAQVQLKIARKQEHMIKGQFAIARRQDDTQELLEWIEAFLVSVYATHLFEMATNATESDWYKVRLHHWTAIIAIAAFVFLLVVALFDRKARHSPKRLKRFRIAECLSAMIGIAASLGFLIHWISEKS